MSKHDGPVFGSVLVRNGRLRIARADVLASEIARLRDGVYQVTIGRRQASRSHQQNAWYWSCVVGAVAEHTGHSPGEIHEIYKAKFLPHRIALCDGNGEVMGDFVIGGTTTTLNTAQFADYCDNIRRWALEALGVSIPDPR